MARKNHKRDRGRRDRLDLLPPFAMTGMNFPTQSNYLVPPNVWSPMADTKSDVLGSYTGIAKDGEKPVQDVDDL